MNTADVLRGAAARVRQGWCQGHAFDGKGNTCAVGSIWAAIGGARLLEDEQSIRAFVARALRLPQCFPFLGPLQCALASVPAWNDAPGQTAENVAAGLEYAALIWEQEQAAALAASAEQSQPAMVSQ